jgi:hypothetical protein
MKAEYCIRFIITYALYTGKKKKYIYEKSDHQRCLKPGLNPKSILEYV